MADVTIGASLKLDAGDGLSKLGEIKKAIKEATGNLLEMQEKFGTASAEAGQAASKVAELRDRLQDANKITEAFNPDTKFRAFGAAINTVVGGFTALQGVMGLVGAESADLQKGLLKVQSALAFSQGISQLQEGVKTFKNLGAVIQQTTLFQKANAVATQLTAGAMKAFGVSVETTSTSFKVLKGAIAATGIGLLVVLIGEVVNLTQQWTESTDKAALSQEELAKVVENVNDSLSAQQSLFKREESLAIARAKQSGKTEAEIFKIKQDFRELDFKAVTDAYNKLKGVDEIAAAEKLKRLKDINAEGKIAQIEFDLAEAERRKAAAEKAAKEAEERRKKELAAAQKDFEEQTRLRAGRITGALTVVRQKTQEEIDSEAKIAASKAELQAKTADLETYTQLVKDNSFARMEAEEAEYQQRKSIAESTASLLGTLSDLVGKQTLAGKILGIAQATINTFVGASEVLRSPTVIPEPAGTIAKIANVAAIIATGLGAVKQIIKTQVPGQGGGGGTAPTVSAPITPQAPGIGTTKLDQRSLNQIGNATVRAFVVESDVSGSQERIRRLNRAARLG